MRHLPRYQAGLVSALVGRRHACWVAGFLAAVLQRVRGGAGRGLAVDAMAGVGGGWGGLSLAA